MARHCVRLRVAAAVTASCLVVPAFASAQTGPTYEVTITNMTRSQPVTPPVVATHRKGVRVFVPGEEASAPLATLAEEGNPTPLANALEGEEGIFDVAVAGGLIMPGDSRTVQVETRGRAVFVSAVGMLATTNDAFFGLDSLFLGHSWSRHVSVPAYDAGSEENNEDCAFIPGPPCNSGGVRATAGAEGFIHIHNGIHGIGDLDPAVWDWHNPVVRIDVRRVREAAEE